MYRKIIRTKNRKESSAQADDDQPRSSYSFLLMKTESIVDTLNKFVSKLLNLPCQQERSYETLRSSRKSFRLNDPAAFTENLTHHRPYVPAKAILPPLSARTTTEKTTKFVTLNDEEKEIFCVYSVGVKNEKNMMIKVYADGSKHKQEIMKVYMDNEPPTKIVQSAKSAWKLVPLKEQSKLSKVSKPNNLELHSNAKKTHYPGDGCKLHDPVKRGMQLLALQEMIKSTAIGSGTVTEEKKDTIPKNMCDTSSQYDKPEKKHDRKKRKKIKDYI